MLGVDPEAAPFRNEPNSEVAFRYLVDVVGGSLMDARVANIADLNGRIARDLLFDGHVPLPSIGSDAAGRSSAARRSGSASERNSGVQRTIDGRADGERSSVGKSDLRAYALALEELANADAECSLACSEDVPSDADARSNVVPVVFDQGPIDARRSGAKGQAYAGSGGRAEVGAGHENDTVAGVCRIAVGL